MTLAVRAAAATAQEEAFGAGLVNFAILVTATVLDPAREPEAAAAIDNSVGWRAPARAPGVRVAGFGFRDGAAVGADPDQARSGSLHAPRSGVMTMVTNKKRKSTKNRVQKAQMTTEPRPLRPSGRGWIGRGRGTAGYVQAPVEYRGTTVQGCGLWPFSVGTGAPLVGVPLGRRLYFDPAGKDLLAGLLLAAALDGRRITDVYTWLTRPADDTAVEILRQQASR